MIFTIYFADVKKNQKHVFFLLQIDPESGEIISVLSVQNMTKYVFQTYYIIVENYAGKTKHGIKIIQGMYTEQY